MKVLVTGSNGLLGQKITELVLKKYPDITLVATGKGENRNAIKKGYKYRTMDITDLNSLKKVFEAEQPDVVIHTAAMTQVDDCEFKKEECVALNITAVKNIAKLSSISNFRLVHLSTDFIFDGTKKMYKEDEEPNPLSYYGWSKLEAEKAVITNASNYAILRTVLVYGTVSDMSRSNIMLWAYNTLKDRKKAKVVDDQFRTPTLADDLAQGCMLAALANGNDIFNIAGRDFIGIYELVEKIANMYGFEMTNISKVSSFTLNQPAKRPP
ncbi:MAG: SDR family oxidoreductase, partial [Bacteroidia bacterium]